ncbi:MAG: 23S rRNA (adenine(2503)-C(2))-methyltransferase RlmN [Lachnospiraceae bacterium]|nr:23S rRNA (adenine(2503)-C(2))-methyltransferase RlmN [Lachnospiraceae bacterium]
MEKKDIRSLSYRELEELLVSYGEKSFRAKQVYEWVHQKLVPSFADMTNLSKNLREKLEEHFCISPLSVVDKRVSQNDGTAKFLFQLQDKRVIESVLMKYKHGNSVCISSQVGCRMGCRFCASTLGGLERNLTPGEMLSQIYEIQRNTGERVSNVVVMGTGEPLDNYDNLISFIRMLTDEKGLHISQRNITVSTCGIVENIRRLADEKLQITLAISLHAPDDETRKELMPIANKYTIQEIFDACNYYFEVTGRRISFEYSLVEGVNANEKEAHKLGELLKSRLAPNAHAHVNLIPVNKIKERNYRHGAESEIINFKNIVEKYGINVTIRREMGSDIDAACGQLRKSYLDQSNS